MAGQKASSGGAIDHDHASGGLVIESSGWAEIRVNNANKATPLFRRGLYKQENVVNGASSSSEGRMAS